MPYVDTLVVVALGALLGFASGLFGTGGGVLLIPILGLVAGYPQQLAQGTAMVTVVTNVYIAVFFYTRRHDIPVKLALAMGLGSLVFTYLAARVAIVMEPQVLRRCFAAFVAAVACHLIWRAKVGRIADAEQTPLVSRKWLPSLGVLAGLIGGFFGVGAGSITPPLLTGLFGMRQVVAQGLTLTMVVPGITVALITYGYADKVNWHVGIPLAVGGFFTVSTGVATAHRLPERGLRGAFGVFLLFSAAALLVTSFR